MVTQLQNETITLRNEREQILNELNSMRENQFDVLERTKREVTSNYSRQVANLQQALVEKERQAQAVEQQVMDLKQTQSEVMERHHQEMSQRDEKHALALSQHEKMHAEILNERDKRHDEHVARISAELAGQPAPTEVHDSDELEAERVKMIKEKLKEMHANEKAEILAEFAREKEQLQLQFTGQFENYRLQAESTANTKLKDMYDQFMVANKQLEEQKKALESNVSELRDEISSSKSAADVIRLEKLALEEQYQNVIKSHSAEIALEKRNSVTLEKKLNDWSAKAERLEAELARSEGQGLVEEEEIRREKSEAISRMSSDYETRLRTLEVLVEESRAKLRGAENSHREMLTACQNQLRDDYSAKLQHAEMQHQLEIEELISKYEQQLSDMKSEHSSQVDILEASVSECASEKGSLEVAEEHMVSLQEQLNRYRNQEKNFEARLAELSQQHREDIAVLRKQLEEEKEAELEEVRLANRAGRTDEIHQQEMARQQEIHGQEMARQQEVHGQEVEALSDKFKAELSQERGRVQEHITAEMEAQMQTRLRDLESVFDTQVAQLRDALSRAEKQAAGQSEEQLKALTEQVAVLHSDKTKLEAAHRDLLTKMEGMKVNQERIEAERNQLSEERDRFQKKSKGLEVDVSICRSADEQSRQLMEQYRQEVEEGQNALDEKEEEFTKLQTELDNLEVEVDRMREEGVSRELQHQQCQTELENLEVEVQRMREEGVAREAQHQQCQTERENLEVEVQRVREEGIAQEAQHQQCRTERENLEVEVQRMREEGVTREAQYQQIYDQISAKNKAIADLQAENDTLKSSVDSLCQKQKGYADMCDKLKAQLESSWGVNEELETLKEQVIELTAYKDVYDNMKLKADYLEESVRSKDENIVSLNADLSQSSRTLAEVTDRSAHFEKALADSANEVGVLRANLAQLAEAESSLKAQVGQLEAKLAELERAGEETEQKHQQAESRCDENVREMDEMSHAIEELNAQLAVSRNTVSHHLNEISEKDQCMKDLDTKLVNALNAQEKHASQTTKMNGIISDMQTRMAAMDAESAQATQVIQDLNKTIEDLEVKLSAADSDVADLQQDKSRLELDLLQSQADPDLSDTDADLANRYDTLQREFETLREQNNTLIAEVKELRGNPANSASLSVLEAKVREQEATIDELRKEIARSDPSSLGSRSFQSEYSRSPLEATLSRVRQSLTEKLQQKAAIEKELGLRRANLERQKAEKQYLEDLLYEKNRFEQELQTQKDQLIRELEGLEGKMGSGHKNTVRSVLDSHHKPVVK